MKNWLLNCPRTCSTQDCSSQAINSLYEIKPDGSKVWRCVCKLHEGLIGDSNMIIQGFDPRTGKEVLKWMS